LERSGRGGVHQQLAVGQERAGARREVAEDPGRGHAGIVRGVDRRVPGRAQGRRGGARVQEQVRAAAVVDDGLALERIEAVYARGIAGLGVEPLAEVLLRPEAAEAPVHGPLAVAGEVADAAGGTDDALRRVEE